MNQRAYCHHLFLACLALAWIVWPSNLDGQDFSGYQVHYPTVPAEVEPSDFRTGRMVVDSTPEGIVDLALVVGSYSRIDRVNRQAFVYDHFGSVDPLQPEKFWDIEELAGPMPPSWAPADFDRSGFGGVNASGRIVGSLRGPGSGGELPFYIDILGPSLELLPIPLPLGHQGGAARAVNEMGEIAVSYVDSLGSIRTLVYSPEFGQSTDIPAPFLSVQSFNSIGQLAGRGVSTTGEEVFIRYTITGNDGSGILDEFFDLRSNNDPRLNELGQFPAEVDLPRQRGNKTDHLIILYGGAPGAPLEDGRWNTESLLGAGTAVKQINDSADILLRDGTDLYLKRGDYPGELLNINDLVIPDSDANRGFRDGFIRGAFCEFSNRDRTGFGWIAGNTDRADVAVTHAFFVLVPTSPGPGISVSPPNGLATTESGGSDSFELVLNTEPTADVTIGIDSSNTDEGTVDPLSLTFTPLDWDTPQSVTITGVDDSVVDDDVEYQIWVLPSESADPDYDNIDPDDVTVVNQDDDGSGGGGNGNGGGKGKPK